MSLFHSSAEALPRRARPVSDSTPSPAARISRGTDAAGRIGWLATSDRAGRAVTRHFADETFGGEAAARAEAERFVAAPAATDREGLALMRRLRPRRNCRSGLPGVSRFVRKASGTAFWVAYWDDAQGRKIQRKFSVSVHGEEEARRLAIDARLAAVRDHIDRSVALQVGGVALSPHA
ncbi:Pathogenesis-related transcriptional factor and ERF protein [Methylobacterium sp. 4-46]|uniref:AP2/ERF family transcription factor n=1 Tax=unclassified Methylobacterium TaxID=2615210 RepID=UPI000165CADA|nr:MULTISPECIES: AP2/ERF family transcription factor [Methylobacterium]ACA19247.1 Pathogenesis-related transcriptional factor and ERF protein [Methylobacterium sp. 4-46]WFT78454.1 AP2/ERF family transcription factor [Methylobacterium nodulans]